MIIFASGRTDIPAFYSEWFIYRIRAGFVDVRNPYAPYGKEIEPNVPAKQTVIETFAELSQKLGKEKVCWRYDPIFVDSTYTVATHIREFKKMCEKLSPYTDRCVISFVDLYSKTIKKFPELKEVSENDQKFLAGSFARIAGEYGIKIESCAEKLDLSDYGVQKGECVSKELIERITNVRLSKNENVHQNLRKHCSCLPTRDIGYYNSCPNLCKYCYANYDEKTVQKNFLQHDKNSSFLIGNSRPNDIIQQAKQETFKDSQLFMF